MKETKTRLKWIDMAKAISILSIMACHTIENQSHMWNLVTGFNVTLFFMLSGYTFREKISDKKGIARLKEEFLPGFFRDVKTLLGPFFVMTVFINLYSVFVWHADFISYVKLQLSCIFISGEGYIAYLWFLLALFWTKTMYRLVCMYVKQYRFVVVLVLGYLSMILGSSIHLPQYADLWFAAMIFMEAGHELKLNEDSLNKPLLKGIVGGVATLIWLFYGWERGIGIDFLGRYYPSPAICIMVGLCACIAMIQVCIGLENSIFEKPLSFIGKNSLELLCIHYVEGIIIFWGNYNLTPMKHLAIRYVMDLALLVIIVFVKDKIGKKKKA